MWLTSILIINFMILTISIFLVTDLVKKIVLIFKC